MPHHRVDIHGKPINSTSSETIEVIISDGRIMSTGSQWGHAALDIDGTVYGMSHGGYDARAKSDYLRSNRAFRDSVGIVLSVSKIEKEKVKREIEHKIKIGRTYNILSNSCSTNVADTLESIGILSHDPRFFFAPSSNAGVSPKELLIVISRSKRVIKKNHYPKI